MARGCICCIKYMLFLFNLLFWVISTRAGARGQNVLPRRHDKLAVAGRSKFSLSVNRQEVFLSFLCACFSWAAAGCWAWACGCRCLRAASPPCRPPSRRSPPPTSSSPSAASSWWRVSWDASAPSRRTSACCSAWVNAAGVFSPTAVRISDLTLVFIFSFQFFIVLLIILLAELILLILFFVYTDKVRLCKSVPAQSNDQLSRCWCADFFFFFCLRWVKTPNGTWRKVWCCTTRTTTPGWETRGTPSRERCVTARRRKHHDRLWMFLSLLTPGRSFPCNSGDAAAWWTTTTGTRPCMRTWCRTAAASSSTRAAAATPPTPSGRGSVCVARRLVKRF